MPIWLEHAMRDFRFAARALRRTPGFTLGAIASLALGLVLTASAMAVANAYLIRSLPYPAADRLYYVRYAPPGPWEPGGMSALDWTSVGDVVEYPITSAGETFYLSDGDYAQAARGRRVTYSFVAGLGVSVIAGRSLIESDFSAGAEPGALIAASIWRERFGADPGAIGRELRTESEAGRPETFRIVGVLPPGFYVGGDSRQQIEVIVPLTAPVRTYMVRLRPDVPPSVAERRITEAARVVARELPADWSGVHLESAHERYAGEFRPVLVRITVAASLVLIIVCANVAVLIVLRTARRQKEIALRLALGSGRRQLVRMLSTEALLICGSAVGIGLLLTHLALGALAPLIEQQLGRPAPAGATAIAIDTTVLLIVGVAAALVALSLSFIPALLAWRGRLADVLQRQGTTTTDGRSMHRLRSGMLTLELAGTLMLLVACGLMIRSIVTMARTDLGFEPERLARSRVVLRAADYADDAALSRFYQQFSGRLSAAIAAPVVFSSWPPFVDFPEQALEVDGRAGYVLNAGSVRVGAGYLATLGIALRSGRDISSDDVSAGAPVAVVSETLARRLWPDGNAVGRLVRQSDITAGGARPPGPWMTIVGVAGDVRQTYGDRNRSDVYTPGLSTSRFGSFYLRSGRPTPALLASMRTAAAALDPRAVVDPPRSVEDENRELAGTRFLAALLAGFAAVAAFIAVLGIYGVTAYATQQREREVAIRLALGADRREVVRLFLKDGSVVLMSGLVVGLIGAVVAGRVLEHQVFAVRAFDLPTLVVTCSLLATTGLLATWWPARRASRRNPVVALKDGQ